MAYNEHFKAYHVQWEKENLKRIQINVRKEYYSDVILPEAEKRGIPVSRLFLDALEEKIARENADGRA